MTARLRLSAAALAAFALMGARPAVQQAAQQIKLVRDLERASQPPMPPEVARRAERDAWRRRQRGR